MTTETHPPEVDQPQANGHQDLKVVLSLRGDKATIGVQRPLCDPFIETFGGITLAEELVGEILGVIARAEIKWQVARQFPKYDRPAPPPPPPRPQRQAARGRQAAAPVPAATPPPQTEQTLRLF